MGEKLKSSHRAALAESFDVSVRFCAVKSMAISTNPCPASLPYVAMVKAEDLQERILDSSI